MKRFIRQYLVFSKSERRGLFSLLVLIILASVTPWFVNNFLVRAHPAVLNLPKGLEAFQKTGEQSETPDSLFSFDPNRVTREELLLLGLTPNQADNILHYREKGGHFWRRVDVLKLYTIDKATYLKLYPYINIPYSRTRNPGRSQPIRRINMNLARKADWEQLPGIGSVLAERIMKYRKKYGPFLGPFDLASVYGIDSSLVNRLLPYLAIDSTLLDSLIAQHDTAAHKTEGLIDLNLADTTQLKTLPGIGSVLARRIVRFREKLGGFYTIEQLREVYHLPHETYQKIYPRLTLTGRPRTLSLNHSSWEKLASHPYISRSLADFIITRRNSKPFTAVEQLRESFLVDGQLYAKLVPYITL